jgi:hypothetical protein
MNPPLFHNRICNVCSLVAATLILPALAYAQNNQGNGGPGFNLGIPNGTYVFNITGLFPPTPSATSLAPVAAVTRITYTPNATGSGGTTSGVASYSFAPPGASTVLFTGVPVVGFFTVQGDGSLLETYIQKGPPFQTLHFISYPTPDANTIAILETDPGAVASGVGTRGR